MRRSSIEGTTAAALGRHVLERYDKKSVALFGVLVTLASSVGYQWSDLVDIEGGMDWLLAGIWIVLAALICWNVNPRRDSILFITGLGGGAVIEWWGTNTLLWSYFTDERPPPWILPAWPCAALAIDRLANLLDRVVDALSGDLSRTPPHRAFLVVYWVLLPGFVAWMTWFLSPAAEKPASMIILAIMVLVVSFPSDHRTDVVVLTAGTILGLFLEYWGTDRQCWTYYTRQTPPPVAVVAHGFASVAFLRVVRFAEAVVDRLRFLPRWLRVEGSRQF